MKVNFKKIFLYLSLLCFFISSIFLYTSSSKIEHEKTCKGLNVRILDKLTFIHKNTIEKTLFKEFGEMKGKRIEEIPFTEIENILDQNPAILKSEAFIDKSNILDIFIRQRQPVLRFQKGTQGFYADDRGFLFPLQANFTPLVPIVDGNIPLTFPKPSNEQEQLWLDNMIDFISYVNKHSIWKENLSQIRIGSNGDLILIFREGKENFIFGYPQDFETKFKKIKIYYNKIVNLKEKGYYSSVNIKYKNQIICKK